jgi:hypothetical protein
LPLITLPIKITLEDWCAQLNNDLPLLAIPDLRGFKDWQEWACQLINDNSLSAILLPERRIYPKKEDWAKWAVFFMDTLSTT